MTAIVTRRRNPYIGPRAFRAGETLHGRDHEIAQLLDLLLAERIVLLHSPSGAGKTSLIQAALVGRLEEEGFEVLPAVRVNSRLPVGATLPDGYNRYVLSALLWLEQGMPIACRRPIAELATLSLDQYLAERRRTADNPVLIVDQLEEVLSDPADQAAKREFFDELGLALRNRERWALLIMRDDYVAAAEPYLKILPTRARTRFRLDLLSQRAARVAVQAPAEQAGVPFTEEAVSKVIDDLSQVWVSQPDGPSVARAGPHVEPMQLQVVCLQLWERLRPDQNEIHESDITSEGDVDSALSNYYADQVATVAGVSWVNERVIRDWFDQALIVDGVFRGQTRDGPGDPEDGGRAALLLLENAHLIRAEPRLGATWYEIAHDRLVAPILNDNQRWRQQHLHALQRQAALWADGNRPDALLLGSDELAEAERWAATHDDELTEVDRQFLDVCRQKHIRAVRQRRLNRALAVLSVIAVVSACVAGYFWFQTYREVNVSAATALVANARADLDTFPRRSIDEGLQALQKSPDGMNDDIRDVLYRGVDATRLRATMNDPLRPVGYGDAALSPDGTLLATGRVADGSVEIWDLASGRVIFTVPLSGSALTGVQVAFAQGSLLAVATSTGVALWNVETKQRVRTIDDGVGPTDLALDRTGTRIAAVGNDGLARVWDTTDGKPVAELGAGPLRSVAFDPSGTRLAAGDDNGVVTIWDLKARQALQTLVAHARPVTSVAFSPRGDRLVTAGQDHVARIWSADTGDLLNTLSGHADTVVWARIHPRPDAPRHGERRRHRQDLGRRDRQPASDARRPDRPHPGGGDHPLGPGAVHGGVGRHGPAVGHHDDALRSGIRVGLQPLGQGSRYGKRGPYGGVVERGLRRDRAV